MWVPWRVGRDDAAEFARRFAVEFTGDHDAMDALFWLDHPDDDAPSGAPSPSSPLVELREALYRPDSTDADRARYAAAAAAVEADTAAAAAARDRVLAALDAERARRVRRARWPRIAAIGAVALVVAAGAVAVGTATTASAPVWIGIDRFPTAPPTPEGISSGGDLVQGFTTQQGTATCASCAAATPGPAQTSAGLELGVFDGDLGAARASGIGIVQMHPTSVAEARSITVAVTCAKPGTYSWIAAGTPNSNGIGTAIARSGERQCTGQEAFVTEPTTSSVTLVQVSAPTAVRLDASMAESR